jgi:hypothetical protein
MVISVEFSAMMFSSLSLNNLGIVFVKLPAVSPEKMAPFPMSRV